MILEICFDMVNMHIVNNEHSHIGLKLYWKIFSDIRTLILNINMSKINYE